MLAAGLVQLAIVWVAVRHAGVSIGFRRPRLTPNVRRLLWLAFPAAITGGITQINTLIGTAIASAQDSAVSSLNLADRVYQLPLGVVGVAVAIVLLPELARALKSGNLKEAANLQNRSVEFTLFMTLPAAAALLVMSEPIVRVLYERGAFAAGRHADGRRRDPGDLRPRPAGLRADQGVHAGLFRPRGHAHADDLRGDLGGDEHRAGADAVSAPWARRASRSPRRSPAGSTRRCCSPCWSGAATGARDAALLKRIPRLVAGGGHHGWRALFCDALLRPTRRSASPVLVTGGRRSGRS